MTKKVRKNPNGNVNLEEWIRMMHTNEIDEWQRRHKLNLHPCPPMEIIPPNTQCSNCVACWSGCIDQVKEYKTYYKVGKLKFEKSELDKKE